MIDLKDKNTVLALAALFTGTVSSLLEDLTSLSITAAWLKGITIGILLYLVIEVLRGRR